MASKKTTWILGAVVAALSILLVARAVHGEKKPAPVAETSRLIEKYTVAGPGRVEPDSEEVKIGSELAGKLREVKVEEGDMVRKGQVLAILVNDEYAAAVASASTACCRSDDAARRVGYSDGIACCRARYINRPAAAADNAVCRERRYACGGEGL